MPIWLRKFTFKQINDYYEEEAKAIKDSSSKGKKSLVGPDGKVNTPDFKKITKAITNKTSYK